MSLSDKLALASLILATVSTPCVLFLAYAALSQTTRPNIKPRLLSSVNVPCGQECTIQFGLDNVGHWYGSPTAVDLTVYCNFPKAFELCEIRYGSVQETRNSEVRSGVGGMRFLKAKGIKLSRHEDSEEVHVLVIAPPLPGSYRIRVSAYSANNASFSKDFQLVCTNLIG